MGYGATSIEIDKAVHRAGSLNSANRRFVPGELPLPIITRLSGNPNTMTYTDGGAGGRFHGIDPDHVAYEPPNRTQSVTITANDGLTSDTVSLSVFATYPVYPQKGYEIEFDEDTKTKKARDGTPYFREDGKDQITWKLGMDRRLQDELDEIWDFLIFHGKTKLFWVYDEARGLMNKVRRISPLPTKMESNNSWSASIIVKGDYIENRILQTGLSEININCGGIWIDTFLADKFYQGGYQYTWPNFWLDDSGLTDPPPPTVLQSVRYDTAPIIYEIGSLQPGESYSITSYFVIPSTDNARQVAVYYQGDGQGTISIGADNVAVEIIGTAIADDDGKIECRYELASGANAIVSAIRVVKV